MSSAALRPGQPVRLRANPSQLRMIHRGTVLEVFDDPKAPLAYVDFANDAPRWVFVSDLEAVPKLTEDRVDNNLRPPA